MLVLLLLGCKKETVSPNDAIIGEWEWFRSEASKPPSVSTPASAGYTASKIFDDLGYVRFFKNNVVTHTRPYEIKYRKDDLLDPNSDSTLVLYIDGNLNHFSIMDDTLIIDQSFIDAGTDFYKRK